MHKQIKQAFEKMQKNYVHLSKGKQFQVLSMIIVNGKLKDDIYINKFNINNFSIIKEHCECQAFENNSNYNDITIIVTIAPCDQCYKNFIKENDKIKKIIYLCEDFLENKNHIFEDERIEPASNYIDSSQFEKLLVGYRKYKHKKELEKLTKITAMGVEESANQPTYS